MQLLLPFFTLLFVKSPESLFFYRFDIVIQTFLYKVLCKTKTGKTVKVFLRIVGGILQLRVENQKD